MQMNPVIAIHLSAALAATAIGPVPLWARKPYAATLAAPRFWPGLCHFDAGHRNFSFVHSRFPTIQCGGTHTGYAPIHLFVPLMLFSLAGTLIALARGQIVLHRQKMINI